MSRPWKEAAAALRLQLGVIVLIVLRAPLLASTLLSFSPLCDPFYPLLSSVLLSRVSSVGSSLISSSISSPLLFSQLLAFSSPEFQRSTPLSFPLPLPSSSLILLLSSRISPLLSHLHDQVSSLLPLPPFFLLIACFSSYLSVPPPTLLLLSSPLSGYISSLAPGSRCSVLLPVLLSAVLRAG